MLLAGRPKWYVGWWAAKSLFSLVESQCYILLFFPGAMQCCPGSAEATILAYPLAAMTFSPRVAASQL